jgi:arylsulfatase A-like enzyme
MVWYDVPSYMKKKQSRVTPPPAALAVPAKPNRVADLLERYATRRVALFFVIAGVIWGGGSLFALSLWNRDSWDFTKARYFWIDVCAVLVCDTLLAGLLISGGKTLLWLTRERFVYAGLVPLLASCVCLTGVLFISLLSWIFCSLHIGFLTLASVSSALLDFSSISPFLSFRESLTLGATLLVALALVFLLTVKAPLLSQRQFVVVSGAFCATLLLMGIGFRIVPRLHLDEIDTARAEGIIKARLLPTATLLWAPVILPDPYSGATVTVPLVRRYNLDGYAARIDRKRQRPNILVFSIESLRAGEVDRTVDGRQVMPTVRRLAKDGVSFTHAYAQGNESLYSMTSVISGLHPLKAQERDRFTDIDFPLLRIPDLLSPVYHTAFISSSNENWQNMVNISKSPHLEYFMDADRYDGKVVPPDRADSGFYNEVASGHLRTGTLDDATTTRLLQRWLREKVDKGDGRPFYAMVSYQTSHYPYEQGFAIPAVFTPNTFSDQERASFSFISYPATATARMWNRYWNSLSYIDGQIASTLDLLKRSGVLENSIVVVHGDHGEMFYENGKVTHAAELNDHTLHVPLILSGANGVPAGEYREPVSLLDIGPMLLDLAGMPPNDGFQGTVPPGVRDARAREAGGRRPVFSTVQNIAFEDSVLVGRWKYVEQAKGAYANLYDLESDPMEKSDVEQQNPQVSECLRETLHEFRRNQIAYYSNAALKEAYFAPRHELARVHSCSVAFPGR